MKQLMRFMIVTILLLGLCSVSAFAQSEEKVSPTVETQQAQINAQNETLTTTKVTGLSTARRWSAQTKKAITDVITISPAKRRTVNLQMYSTKSKKWITKKTFSTKSDGTYKLKFSYPNDWKQTNLSKWRITLKAGNGAKAYTSPTISFTTINRKLLNLNAKSAILVEKETGQIFYSKNIDTRRANASTTKMMTALLALEKKGSDGSMKISKSIVQSPERALGYKVNDIIRIKDLLHATLILSDNGSAVALAEHTAGTSSKFVKLMNEKAKALGCKNTNFVTPHGLDRKNHYSSARDLSIIARHALNNATFRSIVKKKQHTFTTEKYHRQYTVRTTNKLLGNTNGVIGVKTGTDTNAGYCFTGAYQYKGKTYVSVVLGCSKATYRWSDTKKLISYVQKYA